MTFFQNLLAIIVRAASGVFGAVLAFVALPSVCLAFLPLPFFVRAYPTHGLISPSLFQQISTGLPPYCDGFVSMFLMSILAGALFLITTYPTYLAMELVHGKFTIVDMARRRMWRQLTDEIFTTEAGHRVRRGNIIRMCKNYLAYSCLGAVFMTVLGEIGAFAEFPSILAALLVIAAAGIWSVFSEFDRNLVPILRT